MEMAGGDLADTILTDLHIVDRWSDGLRRRYAAPPPATPSPQLYVIGTLVRTAC